MIKDRFKIDPITPLQEFFKTESSSGIVLLASAVLALIVANSPFSQQYFDFLEITLTVSLSDFAIEKPLLLWINDGLMAIFFLLIGLEIKREIKYGELSTLRSALLPVGAAIGGALLPGIIFYFFNSGTEFIQGWAIPVATDIAFAIGILALLGSRIPLWAKVFLTAVAVVDDLIAVLVIALFYTQSISVVALGTAGICFLLLLAMNFGNVRRLGLYIIVGIVMWAAVLKSGVHATVAGVLLGLLIPASRQKSLESILKHAESAVDLFRHALTHQDDESQETALNYMDEVVEESESPLHRLEHDLHPWVAFVIMPVFAFANAGIAINANLMAQAFSSSLTWGIIAGLFFGKQIGIFGAYLLMKASGLSSFPKGPQTLKIVYGLACLSGVGFTMSLFIGGLSFSTPEFLEFAKVGIIIGSLMSGILGYIMLLKTTKA